MIRDRSAEPDFVQRIAAATMKFSVFARLDRVGKDEIMNQRYRTENFCMERLARCAQ
jgi:hypothetical protein